MKPDDETREVPSLGAGGGDRTAAVIRSVTANIPIVGQALAEIITELVPNQRIERVEKYLHYLSEEIASLKISNRLNSSSDHLLRTCQRLLQRPWVAPGAL
jgi:hypothetical protein